MEYVKRQFKQTGDAANDSALKVQQSFTRLRAPRRRPVFLQVRYNAAMRMLPAQFTDIATQLAGGQSPWLILLQQGRSGERLLRRYYSDLSGAAGHHIAGDGRCWRAGGGCHWRGFAARYRGSSIACLDFQQTLVLSGSLPG